MHNITSVLKIVRPGDWAFKLDLMDAYFHVPIHRSSQPFLRFGFQGRVVQFQALHSGLNLAPWIFTKIADTVALFLRTRGGSIIPYLDDWLIHHADRQVLLQQQSLLLRTLRDLGLMLNEAKSFLMPVRVIEFLGVRIDTLETRASLPEATALKTRQAVLSCIRTEVLSTRGAAAL